MTSCNTLDEAQSTRSADTIAGLQEVKPDTNLELPPASATASSAYSAEQIARGKYMTALMGCATCHSDGVMIGRPEPTRLLAGSRIGIAYSNPLDNPNPGVVYPPNLTPDAETGLGTWQDEQIARMIRQGIDRHGDARLAVMPWPNYRKLTEPDVQAIVAYLRSLAPVKHEVPKRVAPGQRAPAPYVYFGVYRSAP